MYNDEDDDDDDDDKCTLRRTGRYAAFERGLLGLNGLMMVDDGTRCGTNKACYDGDCKSLSYVKQQLVC